MEAKSIQELELLLSVIIVSEVQVIPLGLEHLLVVPLGCDLADVLLSVLVNLHGQVDGTYERLCWLLLHERVYQIVPFEEGDCREYNLLEGKRRLLGMLTTTQEVYKVLQIRLAQLAIVELIVAYGCPLLAVNRLGMVAEYLELLSIHDPEAPLVVLHRYITIMALLP